MAKILVIEDEENLRFSIRQALRRAGHDVVEADTVSGGWEQTRTTEFEAVLTDVNLGTESGIDLVQRLREDGYEGAVVVMTAFGTIEAAVSAIKLGADDYLQKPLSMEELVLLIDRLLENRRVRKRLSLYQRLESGKSASGVIGESPVWVETLKLCARLAKAPVGRKSGGPACPTILVLGETGTGKGVLARYIHEAAQRDEHGRRLDDAPFVHLNCSAIPPTLVESELFGHEKGAFTDAKASRPGLFEMADGGTIFLDEIGDMPLDLQAKILTVVEEGTYRRVGSSRDRTVQARVIAATNQPLEQRVEEGKFRRDLLYRLNALTVRIPALRERGDDSVLMAQEMLSRFAREYGRAGLTLTDDARQAIRRHTWPGNARELINMCQRVAMLCEGTEAGAMDLGLPTSVLAQKAVAIAVEPAAAAPAPPPPAPETPTVEPAEPEAEFRVTPLSMTVDGIERPGLVFDFERGIHKAEDVERELIVQALRFTRGNVSKAAKLIGMQRSSFRYRIDRFGLHALVQEMAQR